MRDTISDLAVAPPLDFFFCPLATMSLPSATIWRVTKLDLGTNLILLADRSDFTVTCALRSAAVADHVIEQLGRWLPVGRQMVVILVLVDRIRGALAVDAIHGTRIVAELG